MIGPRGQAGLRPYPITIITSSDELPTKQPFARRIVFPTLCANYLYKHIQLCMSDGPALNLLQHQGDTEYIFQVNSISYS